VDPLLNITPAFPPTAIVHGSDDVMVPIQLSKDLFEELGRKGVKASMITVDGEGHTFAAKMKVGSRTWLAQREGFDFLERVIQ